MGSSSKKVKDKDSRKRRHRSRSESSEREAPKEKKHRHHRRHHKDRKRDKLSKYSYESDDSDVIEVVPDDEERVPTPPPPRIVVSSSSPVPESPRTSADSLSIDETNKLRAKLGLKPLHVEQPSSSSSKHDDRKKTDIKRKDDYGEFYHKPAPNISTKTKQEKLRSRLNEHKEKRNLENKLSKVKLLADDHNDDDTSSWVRKSRKVEEAKLEADKRAKMLEELDAQFGVGDIVESEQRNRARKKYTEKSLTGLRVEHDTESFSEGQTVVLTLKDQQVLDEGDDVLVNVNMIDNEKYKKNIENMKKKPAYVAYGDDDLDEFGTPKPKTVLSQYDEEIDGEVRDSFRIGFDNAAERKQSMMQSVKAKLSNKRIDTLVLPELRIASDYYTEEEMAKFKKPKKKVRKMRTKGKILTADDLEQANFDSHDKGRPKTKNDFDHMDIDDIPAVDIKPNVKFEEEYDDSLERALQKTRRIKQKGLLTSEAFTPTTEIKMESQEDNVDSGNIILNATAEFCRTLGDIPTYGKSGNREETEDMLDFEKEYQETEVEPEEEVEEGGRWNAVDPNRLPEAVVIAPIEIPILDEEPDVGSGVGAALKLAMSKGYLDKEENGRPSNSRLAHLQAQHYSIEDKSYGEDFDRGNRRERYAGPISDFKEKDTFKPNVKLDYIDDEGHILNSKEAFRYLSHKFHGKGPGKNKIEKRLKKTQQEGLMKKMSSTDTPLGTLNMLQAKQKEMQTPYIVLSGGKHTHSTSIAKARR